MLPLIHLGNNNVAYFGNGPGLAALAWLVPED